MPLALQVRNLQFAYPSYAPGLPTVEVLQDVSFDMARGEFVALLGRVGAGKSTLCLALNGLAPHATGGVFRGEVQVAGQDTRRHRVAELAHYVSLVFQDPETQLTQMRVEDEIAFGPENLGIPPHEIGERLEWALEIVGLAGFRDRSPAHLSGGEKQRVTIAATLAMRPEVLVLDEPTSNLDPAGKATIFAVLAHLARAEGIAVLIATQDVERVARYTDRALLLEDGRIVQDAPPARLFAGEGAALAGIGAPQAAELAALLQARTGRRHRFATLGAAYTALRRMPPSFPAVRPASSFAPLPTAAPESLITFEKVHFAYPESPPALAGISFRLGRKELVAWVGPNGSGKTTLAKQINGLLRPDAGRVVVDGLDTRQTSIPVLARKAGYVFQNPDHQIFAPTVSEEVAFSLRLQGLAPGEVAERTRLALAAHGLSDCAQSPPALLGSGQRRQVALAAVLATQPQALILDEPTGGLDRASRGEMMRHVVDFHAAGGAVILITHDMRLVAEYAQRVIVLLRGQVVFDGNPGALFARRDILRHAGLVAPPIVRLAQRLWGAAADSIRTPRELVDVVV